MKQSQFQTFYVGTGLEGDYKNDHFEWCVTQRPKRRICSGSREQNLTMWLCLIGSFVTCFAVTPNNGIVMYEHYG